MEAKRSSSNSLPEELVSKIIAMMPFPSIFKARMLSKAWLARFSPIQPLDDEKDQKYRGTRSQARKSSVIGLQKLVGAAAFQKQVLEWSPNWPLFFPFMLGRSSSWAHELASHSWRSLPSLSFLPENIRLYYDKNTTAGALLFLCNYSSQQREKLYMVNIFTRSWKMLPPCQHPKAPEFRPPWLRYAHIVTNPSMQTYKVIVLFDEFTGHHNTCQCCLQTYDSKSNSWSGKKLGQTTYLGKKVVHFNGALYWTEGHRKLVALDCEDGSFTDLPLFGPLDGTISTSQQLVVCSSSLVMVVNAMIDSVKTRKLMKIDLGSGRMWEIGIGGPALEYTYSWSPISQTPVGHGDCIYFGFIASSGRALTYNLRKDEWSWFDVSPNLSISHMFWDWVWKPGVFQPGLNLFMPV